MKKKFKFAIRYLYHRLFSGFYHLGWKVGFERGIIFDNPEYIHLGNKVGIDPNVFLGVIKHPKFKTKTPRIIIEDEVGIGFGTTIFALHSVTIEKDVMLAPYCAIFDCNHSYKNTKVPIKNQPLTDIRPVRIKQGAWLGNKVTVCPGVTIGRNSVIGANSVVTKDIPDYSVAVGAPAKVIKQYNPKNKIWEPVVKKEKPKTKQLPTISIGIPSFEGNGSLITTLQSIYDQSCFEHIKQILLVMDGKKLAKSTLDRIKHPKLKILSLPKRAGHSARINDILKRLKTDLVILTNDDVVIDRFAIERLAKKAENQNNLLLSGNVIPSESGSLFEKILRPGSRILQTITDNWNNGDNYLQCNGRLLALTKNFAKQVSLDNSLLNSDAHLYILAKELNIGFKSVKDAICWYKNPNNIQEHFNQTHRFQNSYQENQRYFENDIQKYYKIPIALRIKAIIYSLTNNPIPTVSYCAIFILSRIVMSFRNRHQENKVNYWKTDMSTKMPLLNKQL